MTRADPLVDALRLLAGARKTTPGSCAWCGVRLRAMPDGMWPARWRYCGDACRQAAGQARRETANASSPRVILVAVALSGAELRVAGTRVEMRSNENEELRSALTRNSRALAAAVWRARVVVTTYTHLGGPAGPWLCCMACGEGQFVGRGALGRRCSLTPRCPGVLAIIVDPRRGRREAPMSG